jgi:hypothetical protein
MGVFSRLTLVASEPFLESLRKLILILFLFLVVLGAVALGDRVSESNACLLVLKVFASSDRQSSSSSLSSLRSTIVLAFGLLILKTS